MSVSQRYSERNKNKVQSWYFYVRVPNGKYDEFGRKQYKQVKRSGFKTKKEAENAEREFLNKFYSNTIEFNPDTICGHIYNNFFEYIKNEGKYSRGTIRNYTGYYNNHLQMFQLVPINRVTPEFIQAWHRQLHENKVSDHVYNGCIKLSKAAFNYAIKLKQINTNPFADFKEVKIPRKLRKRFTTSELITILETCQNKMPDFYCAFTFAALSGMREGEYCALKTTDIVKGDINNKVYVDTIYCKRT